jgi:hypothetical protein
MSEWCYEFNFEDDDWEWQAYTYGNWEDGIGWRGTPVAGGESINIVRLFSEAHFTYAEIEMENVIAGANGFYAAFGLEGQLQGNSHIFGNYLGGGTYVPFVPLDVNGDEMVLNPWAVNGSSVTIKRLKLRGTGVNPFVPSYSLATSQQAPDQDAYIYFAPITGNPSEENLTVNNNTRPIIIDSYAIDPLTRNLWLHAEQGWLKATASDFSSGVVLKPVGCYWERDDNYTGADRIIVAGNALGNFQLPLQEILNCISNGVTNATSDYPLGNVPWPQTSTVTDSALAMFTHFPMSLTQICQGGIQAFPLYGVGCDTGATYAGAPGEHSGLDIFAPSGSNVYSMADNGLIVGIGIGATNGSYQQRSAAYWGAAAVTETVGYSVIVRYKHLFILYGHLRALNSEIYVGKQINAGALLGQVGTAINPGAVSHTHLEVRSFGADIPTTDPITGLPLQTLVRDTSGGYNDSGILANGGQPAVNIYETAQFFAATVIALDSDSGSTTVNVTGLGKVIVDDDKVQFDTTTPPSPCGMPLSNGRPELTYCSGAVGSDVQEVSGYRGFKLGQGSLNNSVAPDVAPTQVTTAP